MSPVNGDTVLYDHQVSTFQDGVQVYNNSEITGTLKFIEGGLAESGPLSGDGHFVALQLDSNSWDSYDSIQVGLKPSFDTGLVEIKDDPDRNLVVKVVSNEQVFTVRTTKDGVTEDKDYDLTTLYLEPAPLDPILVEPVPGNVSILNVALASDLQSDINIVNNNISGNLIYHDALDPSGPLGTDGHFLALRFNSDDWDSYDNIMVGIVDSQDFPVIDVKNYHNNDFVYKIEDTTQTLLVQTWKSGIINNTEYSLSNLVLLPDYYAPITLSVPESSEQVSTGEFTFTVDDLQQGVTIENGPVSPNGNEGPKRIRGMLKYQSNGIGNNAPFNQPGYYLALELDSTDWNKYPWIMVGDPDIGNYDLKSNNTHYGVIRVDENNTGEKYVIIAPDNSASQVGKTTQHNLDITFLS